MELLVISESKLKVMLSREDMEKHGISDSELNYDDPATRKKLLGVLDEIKAQSGFDTAADKLLIQLYPSRDGGSEMFVTKLGLLSSAAEQNLRRSRGIGVFCRGAEIYFAAEFEDVLSMAAVCEGVCYIEESHLYYEAGKGYYLILDQRGSGGQPSPLWPLLEYGEPIHAARRAYIEEYASPLLEKNAIPMLLALKVGKREPVL